MAVYKPTLCTPFLTGVDARIGFHSTDFSETLVKYLTCKVDTSNKLITGYKIRIFDSSNNKIFPINEDGRVSPIEELQKSVFGYEVGGTNSGINGTNIRVPFFQNINNLQPGMADTYKSLNAIYYSDTYLADHIIMPSSSTPFTRALTTMENIEHWNLSDDGKKLEYDWSGASQEEIRRNAIVLDGDRLMLHDIVLVAGTSQKCGLWEATASSTSHEGGSTTVTTILKRLNHDVLNGERVTVVKGEDCHNTSWLCANSTSPLASGTIEYNQAGAFWEDANGRTISNFGSRDEVYKWEIILYQGNHSQISYDSSGIQYITYPDVDPEWMDMTLSSGRIMGTTPERIQIGGIFGTMSDSDYLHGILPEGTETDPIVLQGKYIELSSDVNKPTDILSGGTRLYIKNYDASFGHVYPTSNTLDSTVAASAHYCQFFEHSANSDDILDTDIVNYTFMNNVSISFCKVKNGVWTTYMTEAEWLAATGSNERYLCVGGDSGLPGINDGDLILFANQDLPKQNGVYTYFTVYTTSESGDVVTTKHCIKRAASYDSWSDYIGKIIYTISGDTVRGANIQSLARGGSYTLWNPLDINTGSSSLYFVKERPKLLFRSKLQNNHTFDLFNSLVDRPQINESTPVSEVDGLGMRIGDLVLYKNGEYGTVVELTNTNYKLGSPYGSIASGEYFYITNGKNFGELVFVWYPNQTWGSDSATWDLHTAVILHNTSERTFISPWTGLEKNMKICLLNNQNVFFQKTDSDAFSEGSKWITIQDFNDKLYFIKHKALSCRRREVTDPVPLIPYDETDDSIPWKYDIKFFFRVSDENPFYSYETPYIKLFKNGEEYSDLSMVGGSAGLYVKSNDQAAMATESFQTKDNESFVVTMYTSQASITGRSVSLAAKYIQFGQSSWESYRWLLYNEKGEVVQDTGKKYDKDISVTFYGLSNDSVETINYTAILLVENDYGNILQYNLDLLIAPGTQSTFIQQGKVFTATPDCATQSILINFNGLSNTSETSYSIYRREYEVYKKPGPVIEGVYRNGKFFVGPAEGDPEVSPKNKRYLYKDKVSGFIYQYNERYDPSNPDLPDHEFTKTQTYKIYKGEWKPVLVKDTKTAFKDFNVTNHRSYQYIIYPGDSDVLEYGLEVVKQTFANYNGKIWQINIENPTQGSETFGNYDTSSMNGEAVATNWNYWSISELIPQELTIDAPIIRHKYAVDNNNIWVFKYSLETGAQEHVFNKEEIQTLGQFPKFGFGNMNTSSGSVDAMLGSEIIPYSQTKYIERLKESRVSPLSSNEKAKMLEQWKKFCASKNPKLLKDIKGQSWIVQVISNSNTPQNFVANVPDKISFQWKQVDSTENVIIYGDVEADNSAIQETYGEIEWVPLYQNNK